MSSMVDDFLGNERTVGKLAMNGSVKGKLQRGYDEDWFAVTLEAGVTYYLTGLNPLGTTGFGIAFFDPARDGVAAVAAGGSYGDKDLYLEFTPDRSGTYYAMAVDLAGNFALAEYTLNIAPRSTPDDLASNTGTQGVLTVGAPARGVFEQRGDVDWFRFRADQGVHYDFSPQGDPGAGAAMVYPTLLHIRDATGAVVETPGWGFNPLASGDYYVGVVGDTEGAYTVTASAVRDDYAGHGETTGRLAAGSPVKGSIDYEHDYDWLRLELKAGEFTTFRLQSEHDYVFGMTLYDAAGARLDYTSAFVRDGLQWTYRATTTGTAYLEVERGMTTRPIGVATPYTVAMSSVADDIGELALDARLLALGASTQGSLQTGADRDAFRLNLEAGVSYRFDLASAAGSRLKLELAGANGGAVLASNSVGADGSLAFTPLTSGDYLVTVASEAVLASGLAYTLGAALAADDWSARGAAAGQLVLGSHAAGKLESPLDRDWFALRLEAGATAWIDAKWDASGAGDAAALRVLDASGMPLKSYVVPYVHMSPLSFRADAAGTYYVEFASAYGQAGSYTVSASAGTPDNAGDTIASATPMAAGATVDGRLELRSDTDVFRLDVVAGRTYDIVLSSAAFSLPFTRLLDASGKELPGARIGAPGGAAHHVFTAQDSQAVYLSVQAAIDPLAYQIRTHVYQDDHPETVSPDVRTLTEGSSIQAMLEHGLDRDLFGIELDAHRTYQIKLTGGAPGGAPPAGGFADTRPYANVEHSLVGGERILKVTTQTAGTYFLNVGSGDFQAGAYTVSVLPFAGDGKGPTLVGQSHANHAVGVPLTERTFSFQFSEAIVVDSSAIVLRDSTGKAVTPAFGREFYPMVKDDTLVLKTLGYLTPGTYTLSLPANSIHDTQGNRYTGPETLTFTTILPEAAPGPGNGLYVSTPGSVVDGGAGLDTFVVHASSGFTFVLPEGGDFVVWNMLSGERDRIRNIERLQFNDQVVALDVDGVAGQAYRLYQAAFNRTPDQGGLGFWIGQMDRGTSLGSVAQAFVGSAEFTSLYGAAQTDRAFLETIYQNVLHRSFDAAGLDFWVNAMQAGLGRPEVLAYFSESAENKEALADIIGGGFGYAFTWMS